MFRRFIAVTLIFSLILISSCGTLMYPERRGSKGPKIDPHVAILDALGLLLFIIPGVIAFAVDFTTGCIYLPGGDKKSLNQEQIHIVRSPDGHLTPDFLSATIYAYTGKYVTFMKHEDTLVCQVDGKIIKPLPLNKDF